MKERSEGDVCVFARAESAHLSYFLCSPFPNFAYGGYIINLYANTLTGSRLLEMTDTLLKQFLQL